jgi:hypothetical protein
LSNDLSNDLLNDLSNDLLNNLSNDLLNDLSNDLPNNRSIAKFLNFFQNKKEIILLKSQINRLNFFGNLVEDFSGIADVPDSFVVLEKNLNYLENLLS